MKKLTRQIAPCALTIFLPDREPDCVIYLPSHSGAEETWNLLARPTAALVCIEGFDWNRDLSPWPAEAVFGDQPFAGQADAFLDRLIHEIIPFAEQEAALKPLRRGVAGYSLAGLFAVYAAYRSELFDRVASVSGSMWFDGWMAYAERTPLASPVRRAYFSVGAKEKRTRNIRMASVEADTRRMHELFLSRGADSRFELNPGNHFVDAARRMAAAIDYLSGE